MQPPPQIEELGEDFLTAHVDAYRFTFLLMAAAAIGALVSLAIVRRDDRVAPLRVFSRRSPWSWSLSGQGPGLTRKPPGVAGAGPGNDPENGRRDPA